MSALASTPPTKARAVEHARRPVNGIGFDRLMAAVSAWLVGGAYLDAWAHHNLPATLETFFTPWHAVLYSGLLAMLAVLVGTLVRNASAGYPVRHALPAGYGLPIVGGLVFALAGVAVAPGLRDRSRP